MTKYKIKEGYRGASGQKSGTICYDIRGWDYGLASDDTRMTGIEHISVTEDPNGNSENKPSFTIPRQGLEVIV